MDMGLEGDGFHNAVRVDLLSYSPNSFIFVHLLMIVLATLNYNKH